MPIYAHSCGTCGKEREDFMSLSESAPLCCGLPMTKQLGTPAIANVTRGGNWVFPTRAGIGSPWVGGGRPKPKTVGRGHGIGGRRKFGGAAKRTT